MSYKFDSLLKILNSLDRGEKTTVKSLMDEHEMRERTILRYIQSLKTAGYPVCYDKKRGSYVFEEGYSLKKPDMSVDEQLAFALAKNILKNFGSGMEKSISTIEQKLSVKHTSLPGHIIIKPEVPLPMIQGLLDTLSHASADFRTVEIVYKSAYSKNETKREVNPYYLFYNDNIWYLRGYCRLRKEVRTFALDRVSSVRVLDKPFAPVKVRPEEELSGAFGPVVGGKPVKVVLRFDAEITPFIIRKKWHESQKVRELKSGGIEVSFKITGLEDIKIWIYRWLPHVDVVSPKKLRKRMQSDLKEALRRCKKI